MSAETPVDKRLQKTAEALVRVNLMIDAPGGVAWPGRLRLNRLPIVTTMDQLSYVEAVTTVLRGTDGLVAKTRPELERLHVELRLKKIALLLLPKVEESVALRRNGQPGLAEDVLIKVQQILGLPREAKANNESDTAIIAQSPSVKDNRDCPSRIEGTQIERVVAVISHRPDQIIGRDELAAIIWPDIPIDRARHRLSVVISNGNHGLRVTKDIEIVSVFEKLPDGSHESYYCLRIMEKGSDGQVEVQSPPPLSSVGSLEIGCLPKPEPGEKI